MYIKLLGIIAIITFIGVGVHSYNSAIKDNTILKENNNELLKTLEDNKRAFEKAREEAAKRLQMVESQLKNDTVIEKVKTEKVYIIRKVKDETGCSATRAPDDILRVFNYKDTTSADRSS